MPSLGDRCHGQMREMRDTVLSSWLPWAWACGCLSGGCSGLHANQSTEAKDKMCRTIALGSEGRRRGNTCCLPGGWCGDLLTDSLE